jgi:hypothetical protein
LLEFCNCSDLDIDELGIVRRKPERVNTAEKLANFEEDARLPNIVGIVRFCRNGPFSGKNVKCQTLDN